MKFRIKIITVSILVIILSSAVWWFWANEAILPEGLIQANGRIEGDHYTVTSKIPGQVIELFSHEGDQVKKGQLMVLIDDVQMRAKLEQARQGLIAAEAQLTVAETQDKQAGRDAKRLHALFLDGTATKHENEQAKLAHNIASNQLRAAKAQRNLVKAKLAEAQSILDDLSIRAPATGVVTTRIVDVGEMVIPGGPLFDIVDLDRLYLKVYIPAKDIGKVRLELPAHIYTDAFPDDPVPAIVRYIASRAEFTPKEVQTPDERVKLVYAVKLFFDENPEHRLTPGLPADAVIRWQENTPWVKPSW